MGAAGQQAELGSNPKARILKYPESHPYGLALCPGALAMGSGVLALGR